ncbi:MAG: response regulator [Clostridiales bacterium]
MGNNNKTILIVDDDPDFLEQTVFVLQQAGYETVSAEGEKEAETLLENMHPDLAIVDLMMENQDSGFVLSYHLKKKYPETPVIIATSVTAETGIHFDAKTLAEKEWVQADAVLDKGIRYEQLLGEIKRLLGA